MKRRFAVALGVIVSCVAPSMSQAQVFGQLGGADPVPMNGHVAGFYLSASDNVVAALGQLRLSFYPGIDFGFQGGLARTDLGSTDRTTLRLGADLKGSVAGTAQGAAADVAVAGQLGVDVGDNYNILRLGPSVIVSRVIAMGQNGGLVPYASLGLLFSRLATGGPADSDFSLPLRLGAEMRAMPEFRFVAELQVNMGDAIGDDIGLMAGVNLPF